MVIKLITISETTSPTFNKFFDFENAFPKLVPLFRNNRVGNRKTAMARIPRNPGEKAPLTAGWMGPANTVSVAVVVTRAVVAVVDNVVWVTVWAAWMFVVVPVTIMVDPPTVDVRVCVVVVGTNEVTVCVWVTVDVVPGSEVVTVRVAVGVIVFVVAEVVVANTVAVVGEVVVVVDVPVEITEIVVVVVAVAGLAVEVIVLVPTEVVVVVRVVVDVLSVVLVGGSIWVKKVAFMPPPWTFPPTQ
jgi:hypothetical protein